MYDAISDGHVTLCRTQPLAGVNTGVSESTSSLELELVLSPGSVSLGAGGLGGGRTGASLVALHFLVEGGMGSSRIGS